MTSRGELEAIEADISAKCRDYLESGHLVAYASGAAAQQQQRIVLSDWQAIGIDWERSSLDLGPVGGGSIDEVRIYPTILAPCRIELLDGLPLVDAFRHFVLGDAEVAQLGREAIRLSPKFEPVFVEGRCFVYGVEEWPLAFDRWTTNTTIHPDPAKRGKFDPGGPADPIEVVIAAEARLHRYRSLITLLRTGQLEARGAPAIAGPVEPVLRAAWSHRDFYFEPSTGDILQTNPRSKDHYDHCIERWVAVVLHRPHVQSASVPTRPGPAEPLVGELFPVKPTGADGLPLATRNSQEERSPRGVVRVATKSTTRKACVKFLIEIISASPKVRTHSKSELFALAQERWPDLSQRAFERAREEAIGCVPGAYVWSASGARAKSVREQSPR